MLKIKIKIKYFTTIYNTLIEKKKQENFYFSSCQSI